MKRSKSITLTLLASVGAVALVACDDTPAPSGPTYTTQQECQAQHPDNPGACQQTRYSGGGSHYVWTHSSGPTGGSWWGGSTASHTATTPGSGTAALSSGSAAHASAPAAAVSRGGFGSSAHSFASAGS